VRGDGTRRPEMWNDVMDALLLSSLLSSLQHTSTPFHDLTLQISTVAIQWPTYRPKSGATLKDNVILSASLLYITALLRN